MSTFYVTTNSVRHSQLTATQTTLSGGHITFSTCVDSPCIGVPFMQRTADWQLLLLLLFRSAWIGSQILIVTQPKATIKKKGLRWKQASSPSPACELQWQLITNDEAEPQTMHHLLTGTQNGQPCLLHLHLILFYFKVL